jgi:glucose/arabinose dehydrogenase/PKD repeat protein
MEVAPDGRVFVSEKCGDLRIIKNGVLLAEPFVSITVDCNGEKGLLGIAFDPNFVSNKYVYVFYTTQNEPTIHSRVSRFTADSLNPDKAVAGSEFAILNLESLQTESHIGGAIEFGKDGKLYISTGENYNSNLAQTLTSRLGKILRINSDGTIPSDNPFYNVPGAYKEIWARGLRNPFTFQFSSTGTMHIADVGQGSSTSRGWEEINVGLAGANYGWPTCEGACNNAQFVDPLYAYQHPAGAGSGSTGGGSITGGPFYEANQFPLAYKGSYFFGDYVQGFIKRLTPTNQVMDFASNVGTPVAMELAPDGSLYYLTIFPGQLHKIHYDVSNNYPNAVATANPSSGLPPLSVTLDGSSSSDLDGDPLTYSWNFGDGSPTASGVSVPYTYDSAGPYTATLTVNDGKGGVDTNSILITVGNPPVGTIETPTRGDHYNAGDTKSFSGSASDIEDITLPASAYEWTIVFHHNTHTHPFNQYNGVKSGSITIPSIGESADDVWYRIYLKVTDSAGLTHTSFRDILPNKSTVTINTAVQGLVQPLQILVDGQPITTPYNFVGVVGMSRTLEAPNPQTQNGNTYNYASWSDGGARLHTISTPATDTTFTATYALGVPTSNPKLTINSVNMVGNPLPGYYTTIHQGSTLLQSGFTTMTFTGTAGVTYTVAVQDYASVVFDHWDTGSTVRARSITLNSDTNINAFYRSSSTPPPPTVPGAPTGLTTTASSPTQINLSWSTPSNNGGSLLTGYKIEVKVGTGSYSTLVANAGTGTSYSHTGLVSGTTYTYRVSAINSVGTSVPSTEASATTQTSPPSTSNPKLTINSVNMVGNPLPGYYTTIRQGSTLLQTGFTPVTFTGTAGVTYTVAVSNYAGVNFNHWENGATVVSRAVTLNSDTIVTAYYTP